MSTLTTNYSFIKPAVFSDVDLWGGYLNTSLDSIDTQIKTTDNFAQAALPKAGGTMSGNIAMGGFKLSGLGSGSLVADSVTVAQNQSNIVGHAFSTGGTVDVLTAIMSPATTAYSTHFFYRVTSIGLNTVTTPTMNIDGLGAKTIKKGANAALAAGDTGAAGYEMLLGYNGTNLILLNPPIPANVAVTNGVNTFTATQTFAKAVETAKGASVASAASMDIWTPSDGNTVHGTGVATVTSFATAPQAGAFRWIIADAAFTITNNVNILVQGAANYTCSVGDRLFVYADTTTICYVTIFKVNGTAVVVATPADTVNWTTLTRTTDSSIASNITLASDPTLQFSMLANTNYVIEFDFLALSSGGGVKYGVIGPAATARAIFAVIRQNSGGFASPVVNAMTQIEAVAGVTVNGEHMKSNSCFVLNGVNAATFALQFAQNTSSVTPLIIGAGSWLRYRAF